MKSNWVEKMYLTNCPGRIFSKKESSIFISISIWGLFIVLVRGIFFFSLLFRAEAYGGSQAKGRIWATTAAYTRATATQDTSRICDLHHSSWQSRILNPMNEARDQTCNFTVPSQIRFRCATKGTLVKGIFFFEEYWCWLSVTMVVER